MDFFLGQIIWFAFDYEVEGFLKCDGRTLEVRQYQALFSLLFNKYGGDGMNNFKIPNLSTETGSYQICINGLYPTRN